MILGVFFFESPHKQQEERDQDDALKHRRQADAPPDTVEPQSGFTQQNGHGNAKTGENNADNGGRQGFSVGGEGTGREDFHAHKALRIAENSQIIHTQGNDIGFLDEDPEDGSGEEDQNAGGQNTPGHHDLQGCAIALLCPVELLGTVVLGDEGVGGGSKAIGGHVGDGLHLDADLLDSHGSFTPDGNDAADGHGNGVEHDALNGGRQTDADDGCRHIPVDGMAEVHFAEYFRVLLHVPQIQKKHDKLGKDRGNGGTENAHFREGANTENQNGIEHQIDSQADGADSEGRSAVARGCDDRRTDGVDKIEQDKDAHDEQVGFRIPDDLIIGEAEEVDEGPAEDADDQTI